MMLFFPSVIKNTNKKAGQVFLPYVVFELCQYLRGQYGNGDFALQ